MSLSDLDAAMHRGILRMEAFLQEKGPFSVTLERLILRDPHPGGQEAFIVRVRFPHHRTPLCRLKVEITYDEDMMLDPIRRSLLHPYSDPPQTTWSCYPLEEIVAEKLRALLQSRVRLQTRGWGASRASRDYYDLWYILSHSELDMSLFPNLLARKCAVRSVTFESIQDFLSPELQKVARTEWAQQLQPFVSEKVPVDQILDELFAHLVDLPLKHDIQD
jgi:hypothetical protein